MALLLSFVISVAAGVASNYISEWLNRNNRKK